MDFLRIVLLNTSSRVIVRRFRPSIIRESRATLSTSKCWQERIIPYTPAEDDLIVQRLNDGKTIANIAAETGRSAMGIHRRLSRCLVYHPSLEVRGKPKRRQDKPEEDPLNKRILEAVQDGKWLKDIASELGLDQGTVASRYDQVCAPHLRRSRRWHLYSEEDHQLIRQRMSENNTFAEIAVELGVTLASLRGFLIKHGLRKNRKNMPFTPADDDEIRTLRASGKTFKGIAETLGRNPDSVITRLKKLNRKDTIAPRPWSEQDLGLLMKLLEQGLSNTQIAAQLGRTGFSVRGAVERLPTRFKGLRAHNLFSVQEDSLILRLRDGCSSTFNDIALRVPGRSSQSIRNRYHRLKKQGRP